MTVTNLPSNAQPLELDRRGFLALNPAAEISWIFVFECELGLLERMNRRNVIANLGLLHCFVGAQEGQLPIRSTVLAAQRVFALIAVSTAATNPTKALAWVQRHDLRAMLSPKERVFIHAKARSELDQIQFSWRIEATVPLLWFLRRLSEMPLPNSQVGSDFKAAVEAIFEEPLTLMQSRPTRLPIKVWRARDEAMSEHWRVRNAKFNDRPKPQDLDAGVVRESHYALNWLVRYENAEWDDVATDT